MRRGFYKFIGGDVQRGNSGDPVDSSPTDVAPVLSFENAELVGSRCIEDGTLDWHDISGGSMHMPVFDLDLPCSLVQSRTPGHYHLLIQQAIPWVQYINLLEAFVRAGLVQRGYRDSVSRRGQGFVRIRRDELSEAAYRGRAVNPPRGLLHLRQPVRTRLRRYWPQPVRRLRAAWCSFIHPNTIGF